MSYTQPLLSLVLLMLTIGAWRYWKSERPRKPYLMLAGILGLFLLSWPPAAWLLAQPLEGRYERQAFPKDEAAAIVVLSGNVKPPLPERPVAVVDYDAYERCFYAAWLYKNWRKLPVLACGGVGPQKGEAFAVTMQRLLEAEGVPASQAWIEGKSQSTLENAKYAAEVLRARGISRVVLVTEALHMPRAERCFRKQGIYVVPAPCCFFRLRLDWQHFLPGWRAIERNELVLHEFVGLAWYRMRGWI
jgi:uncharacterized SAM-binding protein YcdF (DUF218 family)